MKITVVAVGKMKEPAYRALADDYLGRIKRYAKVEEREVKDDRGIEAVLPKGAQLVACEVKGKALTSEQFAAQLQRWGSVGKGDVCFLIGGAEGIPKAISDSAQLKLSLSTMTLPHRLARVLLLEQIYRGFSILKGEPYARE
jgi:23S rRNA (pseudouridine1915-N3)-methyltransferase